MPRPSKSVKSVKSPRQTKSPRQPKSPGQPKSPRQTKSSILEAQIQTILKAAIDAADELSGDPVCIQSSLDVLTHGIDNTWSPVKAAVATLVAKLMYPEWDTRYHMRKIGGPYSLRPIDDRHISTYLYHLRYYDTVTGYALTKSFVEKSPFTRAYSGDPRPRESKHAFLDVAEIVNEGATPAQLAAMLAYLMRYLKGRLQKAEALAQSVPTTVDPAAWDLQRVMAAVGALHALPRASELPVYVVHTLISVMLPHGLFPGVARLLPLRQHTAADSKDGACGDIEGVDADGALRLAIEVKHGLAVPPQTVTAFDRKAAGRTGLMRCVLTTKPIAARVEKNIVVDTVAAFVAANLQRGLLAAPDLCAVFARALLAAIVDLRATPSLELKSGAHHILTGDSAAS